MTFSLPHLGHGIGLRPPHYADFLSGQPHVDWLEVISENFMWSGGRPRAILDQLRTNYPIVLHGVSLSIGAAEPPSTDYLKALHTLSVQIEPAWVSDHLCFGTHQGLYAHDLLPLPYTEEALQTVVTNVRIAQDVLKRPILLENVSSYIAFADSQLSEWEFLSEVAERADCGILLDINNVFVSAKNHGFAACDYLNGVAKARVKQFHLAGHEDRGAYLFDSHDHPITDGVWQLYEVAVRRFGPLSTLIERDDDIPPLAEVIAESEHARGIAAQVSRAAGEGAKNNESPIAGARTRFALRDPAVSPQRRGVRREGEREQQHLFFRMLTGEASPAELAGVFCGSSAVPLAERARVYAEGYLWRQILALHDDFPVCQALAGDTFFDLARDFILKNPSRHPSLAKRGEGFAAFLHGRGQAALADMAALEWARACVFDAATSASADATVMQTPGVENARIYLIRALALVKSSTEITAAWRAVSSDRGADAPSECPENIVVWRDSSLVACHRSIADDEMAALEACAHGATISEVCAFFGGATTPETRAFAVLSRWFADGLVAHLDFAEKRK